MANSPRRTKTVLMIVVPVLALLLVAGAVTAFVLTRNAIDAVNQSAAAKTDDTAAAAVPETEGAEPATTEFDAVDDTANQ